MASMGPTGWLEVFERISRGVGEAVLPLLGTEAGRRELSRGAGGDRTVELDRRAETAALDELRALSRRGHPFSVLSEEVGLVDLGAPWPRVLLDPVDGSLNAKRGLPVVGLILGVLEGPSLADLSLGYVANLISGERWHAVRGGGAFRDGERIRPMRAAAPGTIEVVGTESPTRSLPELEPLLRRAARLRLLGSIAISLVHAATGGVDLYVSPTRMRIFDSAASSLIVREAGGLVTDLQGRSLDGIPVDLEARTTVLASAHPDLHRLALDFLRD
jgi:myo-inositol-1(or 4)-monophosphatase